VTRGSTGSRRRRPAFPSSRTARARLISSDGTSCPSRGSPISSSCRRGSRRGTAVAAEMDLFQHEGEPAPRPEPRKAAPLADRMRPRSLDEIVGQDHLLGPGRVLRTVIESSEPHSMILWGPPVFGETRLASLMADVAGLRFVGFSAVLSGVKEI